MPQSERYDKGSMRSRLLLGVDSLKPWERTLIEQALHLAEEVHRDSVRNHSSQVTCTPAPFIVHPLRVALILIEELKIIHPEPVSAALLHDVVEHSRGKYSTFHLEKRFGRNVALMVSCVTRPAPDELIPRKQQMQVFHDRIAQSAKYTRIVKLAERLDNLRDLFACEDQESRCAYLCETIDTYLPIAANTDPTLHAELTTVCRQLEILTPMRVASE